MSSFNTLGRRQLLAGAAAFTATLALPARAQAYPSRPIRWIVPYTAGGASDLVARVIGQAMAESMGQRFIIENRPGAGGTIGVNLVANAAPDGYTLGTGDNGTLYNNWHLFDKLAYGQDSLEYVAMTGQFPLVLAVNGKLPVKNFQEWQQWAKQNSGRISYGTPGVGSPHHMAMALVEDRLGLRMQHVPYKGDAAAVVDLASGQIQTMLMGVATARQYLKGDRLRYLAITWDKRVSSLPDVPTFDEVGVRNFELKAEQGILMPAGTPKDVVNRINREVAKALDTPAVREKLETVGMYPVLKSPEEFTAHVRKNVAIAGDLIKRKGITIN